MNQDEIQSKIEKALKYLVDNGHNLEIE